jgi:hypothetical protein
VYDEPFATMEGNMAVESKDEILDSNEKKQYKDEELAGFMLAYANLQKQQGVIGLTFLLISVLFLITGVEFLIFPLLLILWVASYRTWKCPACNLPMVRTGLKYCKYCGITLWKRKDPALLESSENGTAIKVIEYEGMQVQVVRRFNEQYYSRFWADGVPGRVLSTGDFSTEEQAIEAAKATIRVPLGMTGE